MKNEIQQVMYEKCLFFKLYDVYQRLYIYTKSF